MAKISLVEDNEMNRDMLSRRLERKNQEVVIAVDRAEGVSKAQSESPDLILMDISLPLIDRREATRRLKAAAPIHRLGDEFILRRVESEDRFQALLAVGFEPQHISHRQATAGGVRTEERRNKDDSVGTDSQVCNYTVLLGLPTMP